MLVRCIQCTSSFVSFFSLNFKLLHTEGIIILLFYVFSLSNLPMLLYKLCLLIKLYFLHDVLPFFVLYYYHTSQLFFWFSHLIIFLFLSFLMPSTVIMPLWDYQHLSYGHYFSQKRFWDIFLVIWMTTNCGN